VLAAAVLVVLGALAARSWRPTPKDLDVPLPSPPVVAGEPAEPLKIRALRVSHYAVQGGLAEARGDVGVDSIRLGFGDQVVVRAELSAPASCYLLALNADGQVQLCWPADKKAAPEARQELRFPKSGDGADLNDEPRGGVQGFVLVAARQPLPPYAEWRQGLPELAWQRLAVPRPAVWRGDGEELEEVRPGGSERLGISELKGIGPLGQTLRQLRQAPGVDAVAGLAFVVGPKVGH
jgi:hypothetical protein